MFSQLWGRITGADKKKALPDQQASVLGRLGDYTIIYPYGMYCDLPNDVWLNILGKGKAIPMTSSRPDSSRGEIILFHPITGSKIHFKNNGDVDITAPNVNFSENVNINGDLTVSGHTTLNTLEVTGVADFDGGINANGTNIDDTHAHSGVSTGPSNTGGVV